MLPFILIIFTLHFMLLFIVLLDYFLYMLAPVLQSQNEAFGTLGDFPPSRLMMAEVNEAYWKTRPLCSMCL